MCKKLMLLLAVFALAGVTAQVGQAAELITAVAHRNTDSDAPEDPQIADSLEEGSLTFVDRTHIYVEIPESLIGAEYVIKDHWLNYLNFVLSIIGLGILMWRRRFRSPIRCRSGWAPGR